MKKYEYVSVHISKIFGAGSEEHRQIIDEYAEKGYRYGRIYTHKAGWIRKNY